MSQNWQDQGRPARKIAGHSSAEGHSIVTDSFETEQGSFSDFWLNETKKFL